MKDETHLWWVCTAVDAPWWARASEETLAPTARLAASAAATGWLEHRDLTCGEEGPIEPEAALTIDVVPLPSDAADDPYRCYERAGGGGRFKVEARREWIVDVEPVPGA